MATTLYDLYAPSSLDFSGGNVQLVGGFDPLTDLRSIEIIDGDLTLDGDASNNENGDDADQFGTVFDTDGTTVIAGSTTTKIYSEHQYVLTAAGFPTITIYRIEVDNPSGQGTYVGYLGSGQLVPGVVYNRAFSNTTSTTAPDYDGIAETLCLSAESLIETADGLRQVGDLARGDLVMTRDNGLQPIRWIYSRNLSGEFIARHPGVAPIVFEKDALGQGSPSRQTRMSPQHRVLIQSELCELHFGHRTVLVPAKSLTSHPRIWQDAAIKDITYVHILFDEHEIVYVDGVEAESFHIGDWGLSTLTDDARTELNLIFPELAANTPVNVKTAYPCLKPHEAVVALPLLNVIPRRSPRADQRSGSFQLIKQAGQHDRSHLSA